MKSFKTLRVMLLLIGTSVVGGYGLGGPSQQAPSGPGGQATLAAGEKLPKDVYADTGNRLPPVKREALDEAGKKLYDALVPPVKREALDEAGKKLYDALGPVGLFGPAGIRLNSPPDLEYMATVNDYLRRKSGLEPRIVQLAILVTARQMDCEYIWNAHEAAARKEGVQQEIIDAVKYRKPVKGVDEKESVVIALGREAFGKHRVSSDTFAHALKNFGNQGLVNLTSLMGDYAAIATLLNTFDQQVRPGEKRLLPIPRPN